MVYRCKCKLEFATKLELLQHIGLGNSRWPSEDVEEHWDVGAVRRIEPITGKEGFKKDKL